jgi:hypothetical protein
MVVYELLLAMAVNTLFFIDGSRFSVVQVGPPCTSPHCSSGGSPLHQPPLWFRWVPPAPNPRCSSGGSPLHQPPLQFRWVPPAPAPIAVQVGPPCTSPHCSSCGSPLHQTPTVVQVGPPCTGPHCAPLPLLPSCCMWMLVSRPLPCTCPYAACAV